MPRATGAGEPSRPSRRQFLLAGGTVAAATTLPMGGSFVDIAAAGRSPYEIGKEILEKLGIEDKNRHFQKDVLEALEKALEKKKTDLCKKIANNWEAWGFDDQEDEWEAKKEKVSKLLKALHYAKLVVKYFDRPRVVNDKVNKEQAQAIAKTALDLFANWTLILRFIPITLITAVSTLLDIYNLIKLWLRAEELSESELPDDIEKFKKKVDEETDGDPSEDDLKRIYSLPDTAFTEEQLVASLESADENPVPAGLASVFGGERVNAHVGAMAVSGRVDADGTLASVRTGTFERPTVRVFMHEETGRAIADAEDPGRRFRHELDRGNVAYEGVGFVRGSVTETVSYCTETQNTVVSGWRGIGDTVRSVVSGGWL